MASPARQIESKALKLPARARALGGAPHLESRRGGGR